MSSVLIAWTVKASVVLIIAFGVTGLMRRASAAARHFVWTLALAGVLVLPVLGAVLPAWQVGAIPAGVLDVPTPPAGPVELEASTAADPIATLRFDAVESARDAGRSRHTAEPAAPAIDVARLAGVVWTAGVGLLLLRLFVGVAGVWWLGRRATMMTDAGWLHTAHAIARRFGLGRGVTLLQGDRGTVPMTWGVLQPVVWLPADADSWDEERRTVVLAHELAHVRRRDALTQWVAHLALALNWFNPLVWIAVKRFRDERERACDDAVLEFGTQPARYADHLLDIVRSHGAAGGPAPAMAMARRSQFEGRLLAILDGASRRGGLTARKALSAGLLATAAIVPMAAIRGAVARPDAAPVSSMVADSTVADSVAGPPAPDATLDVGTTPIRNAAQPEVRARTPRVAAPDGDSLVRALGRSNSDTTLRLVIAATAAMTSDGDKADVLRSVLKDSRLDRGDVAAVMRATATMTSDGDRGDVLRAALPYVAFEDAAHRNAFLESIRKFTSDSDLGDLLVALIERARLEPAVQRHIITMSRQITSDSDKARVLIALAGRQELDDASRSAYVESVNTMTNDSDRRDALTAILPGSRNLDVRSTRTPPSVTGPGTVSAGRSATTADREVVNGTRKWSTEFALDGEHNGKPNYRIRISVRNARITADGRRLAGIEPGGSVAIEHIVYPGEDNPGVTATITRSARLWQGSGGMQREYRVNGMARPWDSEAETWLNSVVSRWGGGKTS